MPICQAINKDSSQAWWQTSVSNPSAWVATAGGFSVQDQLLGKKPYSKEIREINKILAKYHSWNKIGFVSVETTAELPRKGKTPNLFRF